MLGLHEVFTALHTWIDGPLRGRLLGVFGTLEELYAGDDWQAEKARAAAAARRALKGTTHRDDS